MVGVNLGPNVNLTDPDAIMTLFLILNVYYVSPCRDSRPRRPPRLYAVYFGRLKRRSRTRHRRHPFVATKAPETNISKPGDAGKT